MVVVKRDIAGSPMVVMVAASSRREPICGETKLCETRAKGVFGEPAPAAKSVNSD